MMVAEYRIPQRRQCQQGSGPWRLARIAEVAARQSTGRPARREKRGGGGRGWAGGAREIGYPTLRFPKRNRGGLRRRGAPGVVR
jgi:hypothetical protein